MTTTIAEPPAAPPKIRHANLAAALDGVCDHCGGTLACCGWEAYRQATGWVVLGPCCVPLLHAAYKATRMPAPFRGGSCRMAEVPRPWQGEPFMSYDPANGRF